LDKAYIWGFAVLSNNSEIKIVSMLSYESFVKIPIC